jgi:hypothetical protein
MTQKEARLYFPHDSEDDLDDLWEERLFEQKQFFLTRPPLAKVFQAKLKKLEFQYQAYLILKNDTDKIRFLSSEKEYYSFPKNLIECFNTYHSQRNQFKQELLKTIDFEPLKRVISSWLEMEAAYAEQWSTEKSLDLEIEVIKSKEPDPMELLKGLKQAAQKNIETFTSLQSRLNDVNEMVLKEVKRLTLLAKD